MNRSTAAVWPRSDRVTWAYRWKDDIIHVCWWKPPPVQDDRRRHNRTVYQIHCQNS